MFPGYRPSPWANRKFLKHIDFMVRPLRHFFFPDRKLEGRFINKPLLKQFGKGIENRYGNKGYIYANAGLQFKRHEAVEGQPRIADVTYAISEDREYYLKRLEFDGNTKTYDRTLRREFNLMEGELFRNELYQTGLYKIQQLALFDMSETPKIEKVPDEPGQVQVRVVGKEARHDELQVGGGYSGASGGSFNFSFATRNLGGTGNSLNAQATLGTRQSLYSATLYNPWFFDRHIGASFTLTNTRSNLAAYTQRTKGAGVGVVFPQGPFSAYRVNYNFQKINASNFATAVGRATPTLTAINTTQSSMTVGWNFDSRNDIYRANRGGMFNASLAYSGGVLGGATNQWSPTLETTYYYSPFRKQTFAFHLTANYVAAFAGQEIQPYQRLFIGGEFTLRAFPLNGVDPVDDEGREFINRKTNVIEGGNRSYVANFEYVYHVAEPLDIALFYDIGQVYHEKQTTDLFRSLRDVGFELRFYIPAIQAPLRMFWAHNLTPRNCATPRLCDQGTVFQFTIGQTF